MNALPNSGDGQKLARLSLAATGYVCTGGLAAFLILAWFLTAPLFHWLVYLGDLYHTRFNSKIKP
jgi:hypothetical protein